ncbi:MAG: MFS transporter, partial [Bacteroidota bacterium]|nr:MFS transporter [Bacteroidota bacterium]
MEAQEKHRSPWAWIPTLYLAEGLPYVAVNIVSVIMYKRMGISNADIALYTSLLYLPWVIKPIWSPLVDLLKTKRWWIVITQLVLALGFASVALTIPASFFFKITLAFFWLLAFASATHDIAADGFYMLGLNTNQQAKYVGIRSTFYRVATITGQGLLVILAGFLESSSGREPVSVFVEASPHYSKTVLEMPRVSEAVQDNGDLYFILGSDSLQISTQTVDKDSLAVLLDSVRTSNLSNGFFAVGEKKAKQKGWWSAKISDPLGSWIRENFGEERGEAAAVTGSVAVVPVRISGKPEHGREVVLNTTLKKGDKSIALIQGEHLVFTESNWDKPAYMVFQADAKLTSYTSVNYMG